ncbi:MAG: hypothetical protein MJ090_02045 [Clostridia bacterium]|nr:hypothetical protein [Clostridia bacterium]
MGKTKKDKVSQYFENMKNETENVRFNSNKKLGDFVNDKDEFKTGAFSIDFGNSENSESDPLKQIKSKVQKVEDTSLLEKCKHYTYDDEGNDVSLDDSPIYELKSVADILKSDSKDALESLSKKYNITITESLEAKEETANDETSITEEPQKETVTPSFAKMISEAENNDKKLLNDYVYEQTSDVHKVDNETPSVPDISDLDNNQKIEKKKKAPKITQTTIKFVPIKDKIVNTTQVGFNAITDKIETVKSEIEGKKPSIIETKLEENDFDDFNPDNEITNTNELKERYLSLFKKKRISFFSFAFSLISFLFLSVFLIPGMFYKLESNCSSSLILLGCVSALLLLVNFDALLSFSKLFSRFSKPDISALLSVLSLILIIISQYLTADYQLFSETYYLTLSASFIFTVRSLLAVYDISAMLGNLRIIGTKNNKFALTLIDDQAVTMSIAKNTIDGDVLISGAREVGFVENFVKYSNYKSILNGDFMFYQIIGILISILTSIFGVIFFESAVCGLVCFAIMTQIISLPIVYFINVLPLHSAAKKLNSKGAMISGVEGASQIESSNAAVISSTELFPEGSIVLKDMKILSENSIDDTILKATSLTQSVGSTLYPIFRQIAKTNSTYVLPDSDTVKYEDKLGISGWVDNELLFIGNRTLLQSHGIKVPDYEIDKEILQKGCFPVYLATTTKACALLIIKYNPLDSITRDLRKLSKLGVTLFVKNYDPNITEDFIVDFFGIYSDTVKIMNNPDMAIYDRTTAYQKSSPAPACFRRENLSTVRIVNAASALKKSNRMLTAFYVLFSVFMAAVFIYHSFSQKGIASSTSLQFTFQIVTTAFTAFIYLFKKP